MKIKALLILAITLLLPTVTVRAQTFGGAITVIGTTNAPLIDAGLALTNSTSIPLPAKTVTLSGISSTSETAIFTYGIRVICRGATNSAFIPLTTLTNSFASGTNGGTWSTNIASQIATVTLLPYAQIETGAYTNTVYVP